MSRMSEGLGKEWWVARAETGKAYLQGSDV